MMSEKCLKSIWVLMLQMKAIWEKLQNSLSDASNKLTAQYANSISYASFHLYERFEEEIKTKSLKICS